MTSRALVALAVLLPLSLSTADTAAVPANAAGEYSMHFGALTKLSIAVAQAMPAEHYTFRRLLLRRDPKPYRRAAQQSA